MLLWVLALIGMLWAFDVSWAERWAGLKGFHKVLLIPLLIGVPLTSKTSIAGGLDALLAIAQMPPGVPVACVGVDNARNAAVLAARILDA